MARQEIAREPPSKRRPAQAIWHLALGILAGLAALVALTALALALSFTLLTQTRPGRALVLDRVHGALDASLSGQITIGDFRIAPGLSLGLRLEGVRIAGADGAPIARADRVELDLWLPSLLGARIDVERLGVAGLEAELAERAGELNLAKALSARTPSAEEPADRPWLRDLIRRGTLALKGAAIQGRAISFSRSGAPADQRLQLDDFCLTASGLLSRARFEAALELEGTLTSPIARDLAIDAQGSGVPFEQIDLRHLSVRLGGSSLRLRGRQRGASAEAILESLILDRADLAHLAPRFRPGAERLEAAGAARVDQGLATAMLDIALGQGALALHAQSQLKARAFRAVLDVEALDPAQVMVGLPSGAIRARLQGDWQPCSGTRLGLGSIALQLAPSSLGQGQIEALTAVIGLAGDRAEIAELHLSIPGSKLSGSGALFLGEAGDRRAASVEAALALDVDSLASSAKEIAGMAGLSLPEMCGSGQIRARVQGGLGQGARPLAAEIEALFDHLSLSAIQLQGATLAAELPDLKNPLALAGELRARRGHLWHRPIRALSAALRSDGHAFSARLSMQQGDRLALRLGGALAPDRKALRLDRLELSVPRHTWQLGRPAAFDLRDGAAVDRLEMRSGRQVLVLEGGLLRDRLRARLSGTAIDLSAWPRTGLPALRGELDFAAEVAGTVRRPTARLRLLARALAIGPLDALELRLDGELADRMQLGLALSRGRQALRLQAELPRLWEGGQARRPMRARLDLEGVDLGSLGALVPRGAAGPGPATAQPALLPEAGTLSGCAEIAGSPGAPEARLSLRATGVALGPRIPMFDLDLSATLGQALAASAAFSLDRGALDLDARLGLPLARAIGDLRRDRAKRFLDRPLSLRARWQGLDLERMAGPWLPIGARGLLSGELAISGTARAPRGTLALDVRQGVFRALKAIDLSLRLDLRAPRLDLTADVSIAEQGLMRLSGTLGCSAASLIAASDLRRHLGRAPLDVSAELGPIGLEYLLGPSALSMGSLEASAALNGNLELPRLALKGMLRDFWLGPEGIGVLRFEGGYAEGRLSLDSKLLRLDKIAVNSVAPLIVEEVDRVARGGWGPGRLSLV